MNDEERQRYEYERAHRAAQAAETWAVVDEAGVIHEVGVVRVRDSDSWAARVHGGRTVATSSARAAVVLAQGQPSAAELTHAMFEKMSRLIEHERGVAVAALEDARMCLAARDAASAGMAWQSVAIEAGDGVAAARASEVAHLEARRGALIAEVDRLAARDRDAGVVIEDLRKMLAGASVDLAAARDDAAQARLDGAREMRERAAQHFARRAEGAESAAAKIASVATSAAVGATLDEARRFAGMAAEIRALPLTGGAQ